jgi:hypothetical protein
MVITHKPKSWFDKIFLFPFTAPDYLAVYFIKDSLGMIRAAFFPLVLTLVLAALTAWHAQACLQQVLGIEHEIAISDISIINDTDEDLYIYNGQTHIALTRLGGATSIPCEIGRRIYRSNGKIKGSLLFTVQDYMCGKPIKISAYL